MPKKIKSVYQGGGIDRTIKKTTEEKILSFTNGEKILEEFKKLIGDYRFGKEVRKSRPNKSTIINHLEIINNQIFRLLENLDLIPPELIYSLDDESNQRHGEFFFTIQQRLKEDLYKTSFLLSHSLGEVDNWNQQKGEKQKHLEHNLLTDVAFLLENNTTLGKTNAAGEAAELLRSNGVQNMPATPSDARKRVREAIHKKGKE